MTKNTTATAPATYSTREEWLIAAIAELAPLFAELGHELPTVRVSVGWGSSRAAVTLGECWHPKSATDGVGQVFIAPSLDDAVRILDVLAHELVHAINHRNGENGHGAAFARIAKPLGLTGKMTASVAGEELKAKLVDIADRLGAYPHAALALSALGEDGAKKQGTRMLKVECAEGSGYIVRMTRKWLDEYGTPSCPCHGVSMEEAA
ncbi:SprT-like protease [Microbacterium phage Cen1621]|uniref:SprT-like protease n=1 Tax=Microbacterium phage Cen1621 TaxID=2965191 RepID=A0A9E7TXN3_9CAUD|nr:SprT-like protease [Microbacterium phage Cen1621]